MEAFSEFARIRMIMLLASSQDELSLMDFVKSLKLTRSQALLHTKALRKQGLLKVKKKGPVLYYRMNGAAKWMPNLLGTIQQFPNSEKQFAEDLKRFTKQLPKVIKPKR